MKSRNMVRQSCFLESKILLMFSSNSFSCNLQKSLAPNLPDDLAISFYLQSHKLIFAVYQLTNIQGTMKFDSCQAECSVPWLNEVLVLFTVALQLCQQLKDKVCIIQAICFIIYEILSIFLSILSVFFIYFHVFFHPFYRFLSIFLSM